MTPMAMGGPLINYGNGNAKKKNYGNWTFC